MSAFFLIVLAYIPKHDGLSDVIRFFGKLTSELFFPELLSMFIAVTNCLVISHVCSLYFWQDEIVKHTIVDNKKTNIFFIVLIVLFENSVNSFVILSQKSLFLHRISCAIARQTSRYIDLRCLVAGNIANGLLNSIAMHLQCTCFKLR